MNSSPNAGDLVEIDPTTGTPTGNRITRNVSNAAQGGCCWYQRSSGSPFSELLVIDQGAPDTIAGSTPSAGTGATSGNSGTTYMFCETSGAQNTWPKTFVMDTVALNTCSNPTPNLFFAYHLWGTTVGTLTVETIDAVGTSTGIVFTIAGNQGNQWNTATVPVTPIGGTVRVRFTYVTPAANNSWVGDACLDDVFIL